MTGASAASNGRPERGRGLGRGPRFLWAAAVGLEYAGAARMVLVLGGGQHRKRRSVRGAQRLGATPGSNDPLGRRRRSSYAQRYKQRFEPVAWLGVEAK